jgi:hypothetical protein
MPFAFFGIINDDQFHEINIKIKKFEIKRKFYFGKI